MADEALEPGETGRVIEAYRAAYPDPLSAYAGETLTFGRKDQSWPGWVWCANREGKGGWVPESFMRIKEKICTMQRDYVARELSVRVGDLLTLHELESGWYWASDRSGRNGWVPAKNVKRLNER
jgi:uncharacterized protein YgiM (DUF1202 family)